MNALIKEKTMTVYTTMASPLGELLLVGEETTDGGLTLTSLSMPDQKKAATVESGWRRDGAPFADVVRQVAAYFDGTLTRFDLTFGTTGTDFQQRVWRSLEEIPYGTTTTYGDLTEQTGLPRRQAQAVAAAVGANPLLLVRPCHRVIGADGTMRGYAAGVGRKTQLLGLEGALPAVPVS